MGCLFVALYFYLNFRVYVKFQCWALQTWGTTTSGKIYPIIRFSMVHNVVTYLSEKKKEEEEEQEEMQEGFKK